MPISDPPAAGSVYFTEGLSMESVVDLSSIPSARSSHTGKEVKENNPRTRQKRPRDEVDPEEVTSSLSGSAKRHEMEKPISATPLASMPPPGPTKPARLFSLGSR